MTPSWESVLALSRQYCDLIEGCQAVNPYWLASLAHLLRQLDAAVKTLGRYENPSEKNLSPDLDARFELFTELLALLGKNDSYWQPFDRAGDWHAMTGSLSDDLTDIYCELKHALKLSETQPEQALSSLYSSYLQHWGQHLQDAERHLDALLLSQPCCLDRRRFPRSTIKREGGQWLRPARSARIEPLT